MNSPRSFRTTELAKEFARQGHEVTVLTVRNDEPHDEFEAKHGVTIREIGPLLYPVISQKNSKGRFTFTRRAAWRTMKTLFEYPDIELMFRVKKALKKESGYHLLISIAVPHTVHWGVAAARNGSNTIAKTWIADCGDPYMGEAMDSFRKAPYFKYMEKWFCKKADAITVPILEAKEAYYPEFRNKIHVVPQGFNFDEAAPKKNTYVPNAVPTFAYAGGLIPGGRDPRPFLDFLVNSGRDFRFILYTRNRDMAEPFLNRGKGVIEVRDYLPRKELLSELAKMDFLVNFENKAAVQLPSKLIDYYLAGRPVLSLNGADFNPDTVFEFLNGKYEKKYPFGDMDPYRIENVCNKFLSL
jgi:hypothetical protein